MGNRTVPRNGPFTRVGALSLICELLIEVPGPRTGNGPAADHPFAFVAS